MTTVVDANKLDVPPSYNSDVDTAGALLDVSLWENDEATEPAEEAAAARGDDDDDNNDSTVDTEIVDVNVDVDAAVALSVGKVNCLEKDVVELLDEGAKVKGGFPGPFPIAGTEPICLPGARLVEPTSVDEIDGEMVANEEAVESEDAEADIMG